MTFEQWWEDLTTREQHVIGYSNAKFVWDQARESCALMLEQNALECTNPIHRSLLQSNANEIRKGRQDD
jgi:hypothetical protein